MRAALEDLHIRPPGQLADVRLPGMAGNRLPSKMARMSPGCGGYSPAEKGHPLFLPRGCPFSIISIISIFSIAVSRSVYQGIIRPLYTGAVISCRRFRLYSAQISSSVIFSVSFLGRPIWEILIRWV